MIYTPPPPLAGVSIINRVAALTAQVHELYKGPETIGHVYSEKNRS